MSDELAQLLVEVREVRKLLELLAEPAVAQRDAKLRGELRKIVGSSAKKQHSVYLMDGTRTQAQIVAQTLVHQGELSTMVGKFDAIGLLLDGKKHPKLAITVPSHFFDDNAAK